METLQQSRLRETLFGSVVIEVMAVQVMMMTDDDDTLTKTIRLMIYTPIYIFQPLVIAYAKLQTLFKLIL
jgi:hypothetical protein